MPRLRRRKKPVKLTVADLRGVIAGSPMSFKKVKDYLAYDEYGNNVLSAYLRKTTRQLSRLPDSEYGDLVSEADKQIWRCAGRFIKRIDSGGKGKIKFKVYYYQRLKQCMADRVKATIKLSDVHNTAAFSLDQMVEEKGFEVSDLQSLDELSIDVRQIIGSLPRRERLIVERLFNGATVSQIRNDLITKFEEGRDRAVVKRKVNKFLNDIMSNIQDAFYEIWRTFHV